MRYMGGKCLISNEIALIINPFTWGGMDEEHRPFVSLFCGGCAIEAKVKADIKICNDIHPYLIAMWKGLQNGWTPPDAISKEEYQYIKAHKDENPALTGFVGFGCSFGGKWFGGYAYDKRGDDYCGQAKRGVMRDYCGEAKNTTTKDMTGLKNATFICGDYRDVVIPEHSVVYADPPYEKSTKYSTGDFDYTAFWDYMRQLAKQGHTIFISEEHAPDDFMCIWHKEKIRTLKKDDNVNMVRTERLWTI